MALTSRTETLIRCLRVFTDLRTGCLAWSEHQPDLAGQVVATGAYGAGLDINALFDSAVADGALAVDVSEWWNGDSIAVSGPAAHPFIARAS